jgi:formylglycine-generating enzyme required for sulfatase activity
VNEQAATLKPTQRLPPRGALLRAARVVAALTLGTAGVVLGSIWLSNPWRPASRPGDDTQANRDRADADRLPHDRDRKSLGDAPPKDKAPDKDARPTDQDAARDKKDKDGPPDPPRPPSAFVNKVGMKLVRIKPGSFTMGSPPDEEERGNDETPHKVTLTKGFYMAATLVTQWQWEQVMGKEANHSRFTGDKSQLPVDYVSWDDCQDFCKKLSALDGRKYELPTEAEWEYACRAGTKTPFWFGDSITDKDANYNATYTYGKDGKKGTYREKTTPVQEFKPNPWGLYDMHGNLQQWCQDYYAPYPEGDITDPSNLKKSDIDARVLRGGSWIDGPVGCRAACRGGFGPHYRVDVRGCRVVCRLESDASRRDDAPSKDKDTPKDKDSAKPTPKLTPFERLVADADEAIKGQDSGRFTIAAPPGISEADLDAACARYKKLGWWAAKGQGAAPGERYMTLRK